ncbi:IclR family transcriptional regulator [Pseudomonas schmalbachii]|uniref:IclR family transcriptional regulator n=1 Tax=Pseudomonas schmalbachii TaxID=2816993 RepID=A0ABS3TJN9_9PSED|nr:IclR family transcriptional regulator [Pseudomonas schmalbachii]MBO3273862.1 IclR family transcriptional regulator [Pseudomonas schmalbachii]
MARDKSKATNEQEETAPTRGKVQSAEVGTEILKGLAALAPSTSLKGLAEHLGMPPAKVHRYLQALIASGFAEQDPATTHYGLGREALYVGLAAIRRLDVVRIATPYLAELRDRLGQTCFLAIWGSHGPTVVQVEPAQGMVTLVTQIGSVLPLHGSSTGLVFAAFRGDEDGDGDVLEQIRRDGIHSIHGLLMPGVNALSAPLFATGRQIAGVITVVGSAAGFDAEIEGEAAGYLREVAGQISERMGGQA